MRIWAATVPASHMGCLEGVEVVSMGWCAVGSTDIPATRHTQMNINGRCNHITTPLFCDYQHLDSPQNLRNSFCGLHI